MRQVNGEDVTDHDQGDLRVPDEGRPHEARVYLVSRGADEVPAPPERIRVVADYLLSLDEQERVVVRDLISNGDGHERVNVDGGQRSQPEPPPPPAKELAELDEA